jgi:hypothetical protein
MASLPVLPSNPNENEGPKILGVTIAITSIALLVVLLRLYVRWFMVRAVGWDVCLYNHIFMTLTQIGPGLSHDICNDLGMFAPQLCVRALMG